MATSQMMESNASLTFTSQMRHAHVGHGHVGATAGATAGAAPGAPPSHVEHARHVRLHAQEALERSFLWAVGGRNNKKSTRYRRSLLRVRWRGGIAAWLLRSLARDASKRCVISTFFVVCALGLWTPYTAKSTVCSEWSTRMSR